MKNARINRGFKHQCPLGEGRFGEAADRLAVEKIEQEPLIDDRHEIQIVSLQCQGVVAGPGVEARFEVLDQIEELTHIHLRQQRLDLLRGGPMRGEKDIARPDRQRIGGVAGEGNAQGRRVCRGAGHRQHMALEPRGVGGVAGCNDPYRNAFPSDVECDGDDCVGTAGHTDRREDGLQNVQRRAICLHRIDPYVHRGGGLHVQQAFVEPCGIGELQQVGREFLRVVAQEAKMGADLAWDSADD